ncbi:sugar phosphate isomerase/epimerase family protein [Anaerobium acetethylicum]|uniref:Hydroxypyruvate isomerase n=1 Tax=Anaerobium acetethylicum TaxID=1619234 RepID=A0A1D3TWJ0_9FIRM|nr:sugar phosphate isomerase/epimerase family protein [Anaerobium acetethylicum]SCP98572.1 hydroxypyruvate isomerase [Anaerobium acetethylicum]
MKYCLCIDLLYLELGPAGPVFSDTTKLLAGMELAKKTGYKAVEFWDWDTRDWKALVQKKQELGLEVSAICAKDRGTLADASTHDKAVQGMKETIEAAKQFECKNIIIVANAMKEVGREESHKNIVEGMKKLVPLAEEAGVTLILEPIVGSYFTDSAEPFAMLEEVDSENVKLLYDIFHYQTMEGNVIPAIKKNLDKIGHIHAAGCPERHEITDGELNYDYIIREIKKMGYDKYFGIEYLPTKDKEVSVIECKELIENA